MLTEMPACRRCDDPITTEAPSDPHADNVNMMTGEISQAHRVCPREMAAIARGRTRDDAQRSGAFRCPSCGGNRSTTLAGRCDDCGTTTTN